MRGRRPGSTSTTEVTGGSRCRIWPYQPNNRRRRCWNATSAEVPHALKFGAQWTARGGYRRSDRNTALYHAIAYAKSKSRPPKQPTGQRRVPGRDSSRRRDRRGRDPTNAAIAVFVVLRGRPAQQESVEEHGTEELNGRRSYGLQPQSRPDVCRRSRSTPLYARATVFAGPEAEQRQYSRARTEAAPWARVISSLVPMLRPAYVRCSDAAGGDATVCT